MSGLFAHRVPWIDREFRLTAEPENAAEIIDRLLGAHERVRAKLACVEEGACRSRLDDGWTINQNIGHLGDLEPLWSLRTRQFSTDARTLAPADMSNHDTDAADHNCIPAAVLAERFHTLRRRLCDTLSALAPSDFQRACIHERLGLTMTLAQHCEFVAMHDDYHLARIQYLAEAVNAASSPGSSAGDSSHRTDTYR